MDDVQNIGLTHMDENHDFVKLYNATSNNETGNEHLNESILTTNLAAIVCVDMCQCAKCDRFLPARKRTENFVRIAKFPYAAFGPLFAFHCPSFFFTRNNDLEWESSRFAAVVRRSVADKQLA